MQGQLIGRIVPALLNAPAGFGCEISGGGGGVLHAVFGNEPFIGSKGPGLAIQGGCLFASADESHFDALMLLFPPRSVVELIHGDRAVEVTIEAMEKIVREGCGDASGIVIGGFELRRITGLIETKQQWASSEQLSKAF